MLDKPSALALLERLRDRISFLRDEQRLGGNFYQWYLEVLDTLDHIFGVGSEEVEEFQRIPFEIDQEVLHPIRRQLALPATMIIPQDSHYDERLYDAEEFLLAMILNVRQREDTPPL